MNSTSLYVSTCRLVLQADSDDPNTWTDLYRLVPYLRQSLSCTVCSNLLIEPHTPTETNCQHHVCRNCRGGRKKLKPSCGWCKDYNKYIENVQLRILLQCYKKLCEYLTSTNIYRNIILTITTNKNNGTNFCGASSLIELIQEGSGFKDEYKSNSGLSKSAYSILPCVYTSTTSTQTQGISFQTNAEKIHQTVPESPTIKTVSNGSSIYSVMYAGTGNKITIKRKAATNVDDNNDTSNTNTATTTTPSSTTAITDQDTDETSRNNNNNNNNNNTGGVKCIPSSQLSYGSSTTSTTTTTSSSSSKKSSKGSKSSTSFKKPRSSSTRSKRKGCRCGNATAIPGKLTCCGQRCPCYVESKPCLECRCRGCRNPHTADGLKIRPHIPELHNLHLQLSTTPNDCENALAASDPLETVQQCLSTSPTTIQVLNVYSTPRLDIDNVPQNLPAALLVGEDAIVSTESEADDSDIQIDV